MRLENAKLKEIAAKLEANEESLVAATKKVKKALKDLEKVAQVVKAVNKLLEIVVKIV